MKHIRELGFIRVAAVVPELSVGDPMANVREIFNQYRIAAAAGASIVVTPELSITGYTCGDLFGGDFLLDSAEEALSYLLSAIREFSRSSGSDAILIAGAPVRQRGCLYNCALVIRRGEIIGAVPKTYLPNSGEFYEMRHFAGARDNPDSEVSLLGAMTPFGTDLIFGENNFARFGIELCEDAWVANPPSNALSEAGANIIINLSASNEVVGKAEYRRTIISAMSGNQIGAYIYVSAGPNESSSDLVFGGHTIIAEYGGIIAENKRFELESGITCADINVRLLDNYRRKNASFRNSGSARKITAVFSETGFPLLRRYSKTPFVPDDETARRERCEEILEMQATGLAKRLKSSGIKKCVLGLSGGLDSTLAFLVVRRAYRKLGIPDNNLIAVTMPGFGTTDRTYNNACTLAKTSGADLREISIRPSVEQHFRDIGWDINNHSVTYENAQARERTQILFDIANAENGLVIGTGDLSEFALGWATYSGDHMSHYAVNCSIPKTLVRYLVSAVAMQEDSALLRDILSTPVSPELLPPNPDGTIFQETEDIVGPYELHDYFIYHRLRLGENIPVTFALACDSFAGVYDKKTIFKWLKTFETRFAFSQFKRNCVPDGPKVGTVSLSPRGDLRMPSDMSQGTLLDVLDEIEKSL